MNLILSPYFKLWVPFNSEVSFNFIFPCCVFSFFKMKFPSFVAAKCEAGFKQKKKATRKISTAFSIDLCTLRLIFVRKKENAEILHTDTSILPFYVSPTARKPNDVYIFNLENLLATYYLVCACFPFFWLEPMDFKLQGSRHDIKCTQNAQKGQPWYRRRKLPCVHQQCQGWIA